MRGVAGILAGLVLGGVVASAVACGGAQKNGNWDLFLVKVARGENEGAKSR